MAMNTFQVDSRGGQFDLFSTAPDHCNRIHCNFQPNAVSKMTKIIIQQETPSRSLFPRLDFKSDNCMTNVIHLLPHGATFRRPVRVDLYYRTMLYRQSREQLSLLYSDTAPDEKPVWRDLTSQQGPDDPEFEFKLDHCTIRFPHFCTVIVLKSVRTGDRYYHKIVAGAWRLRYKPKARRLEVAVVFQPQCREPVRMQKLYF